MDLLKTILIYMSMIFVSSVQTSPEMPVTPAPTLTATPVALVATATPAATPTPTPVPTPNITPNVEYKTIRVGDKGENVKTMQRRLAELGYYAGDIDGVFGNQTRRSVERFQYYQGLAADGIAGKRTLTVLYESKEVVFAPADVTPTPSAGTPSSPAASATPDISTRPTVARTPGPGGETPAPTFMPTGSPTPVSPVVPESSMNVSGANEGSEVEGDAPGNMSATPPQDTAGPAGAPTEAPPALMEGYGFLGAGKETPLLQDAPEGEEAARLLPLGLGDGTVMVPFLKLLAQENVMVLPQEDTNHAEYAFAIDNRDVYRLVYDVGPEGQPTGLAIYKNGEPQLMQQRTAVLWENVLYLPITEVTAWTGIPFVLDEDTHLYTYTMPAK